MARALGIWLALLVVEFLWSLTPLIEGIGTAIWVVFLLDFALRFTLAPDKETYLRSNWLTALALLVPAFRVFRTFRVLRAPRATRGLRGEVRTLSSRK
jgi:voltage-gated potassium channel